MLYPQQTKAILYAVDRLGQATADAATSCHVYAWQVEQLWHLQYTLDYYMAMAEELVNHGVHALGIKDMAGVLKPRAASQVGP